MGVEPRAEMRAEIPAEVRTARLDDAAEIARVHVASWRAAYPGMVPQEILDGLSVERRTERWAELLGDEGPRDIVLVAERDGVVVGFASAGPSIDGGGDAGVDPEETALLHAIYLDESAWGQGIGTALLDATLERLTGHGFGSVTLWVIEANDRARRFYEARGWTTDGSGKQCFGMDISVDVPTIRYRKRLS